MMRDSYLGFYRTSGIQKKLFEPRRVYACADGNKLIISNQRKKLIAQIASFVDVPSTYFDKLYLSLIHNYAEYVQVLPDADTFKGQRYHDLLDTSLARSAYALSIRLQTTLPPNADDQTATEQYALWSYVMFSSCLLQHIGKLATNYSIAMCNDQGVVAKQWNPLLGNLISQSDFYKIRNIDVKKPSNHQHALTHILAMQIMPKDGFRWIAEHPLALETWLAALTDEDDSHAHEKITNILSLARSFIQDPSKQNELLLELELLNRGKLEQDLAKILAILKNYHHNSMLPPVSIAEPVNTQIGEHFFEWLKESIDNKSISINNDNSPVHITEQGVILLYPEIFQLFIQSYPIYRDWVMVYTQFSALGIANTTKQNTNNLSLFQLQKEAPSTTPSTYSRHLFHPSVDQVRGLVVKKSAFPSGTQWPGNNNFLKPLADTSANGKVNYPKLSSSNLKNHPKR